MLEAGIFGIALPCALSLGFLAGIATVSALNRDERRRLRYLTRYTEHCEREIAAHRLPDSPPIALVLRPSFDRTRAPMQIAPH